MEKENILYIQAQAGISGDMFTAALLDLGADPEVLQKVLNSIPQEGFTTEISRVSKAGISCCDFAVLLDEAYENHDHDMAYLHGHAQEHEMACLHGHEEEHEAGTQPDKKHKHKHKKKQKPDKKEQKRKLQEQKAETPCEHEHGHGHEHTGEHEHGHEHGHQHACGHAHTHRTMADVSRILAQTEMTENARAVALKIFDVLAEAEAKAHGTTRENVHFHEVGAVDSIVDIVAAAVCLDNLGVQKVVIPYLCEGQGTVRTQHGILPIPVPAVAAIAETEDLALHILDAEGEFVTPTGAAICAAIRTDKVLPEHWRVKKTGYGAGKRTYSIPSLLRVMLLEEEEALPEAAISRPDEAAAAEGLRAGGRPEEGIWKLESNIDDCSGEILGYVSECLFAAGARDVFFTPIYMKKNRPAWQLSVLCDEEVIKEMEQILFRETTTIGIRRVYMERTVLPREIRKVRTSAGEVDVKVCLNGEEEKVFPEYESAAALARETGRPLAAIFREARESMAYGIPAKEQQTEKASAETIRS